jgi:epoxyqueuosine reductase QueG
MREYFKKIASFLMAFIVLFSTFSFTVNEHYCGNTLKDSAIFIKAEKCLMEMKMETPSNGCDIYQKKCCDDVVKVIKGQDQLKISIDNLTPDQQLVAVLFFNAYLSSFEQLVNERNTFTEYPPPHIVRNIYKLDEVYLI